MNLIEQFDRLDKLIVDRSPDVAKMRGILYLIREHLEAYQQESETKASLIKKQKRAVVKIKAEHTQQIAKRDAKISELQRANSQLRESLETFYSNERANRRSVLI